MPQESVAGVSDPSGAQGELASPRPWRAIIVSSPILDQEKEHYRYCYRRERLHFGAQGVPSPDEAPEEDGEQPRRLRREAAPAGRRRRLV